MDVMICMPCTLMVKMLRAKASYLESSGYR